MFRRCLSLLLCLVLLPASAACAMTRNELRAAWQQVEAGYAEASPYLVQPVPERYEAGILTDAAQQSALDTLNFLRSLAGLEPVELSPLYALRAQSGAMLLAANDFLEHDAPRPAGMDEAQYESAHMGTSLGNIAKFNWMRPRILIDAVTYFARDDGAENLADLGHRRWLLNPEMAATGFGLANSASGMSYVTMYAVDNGNADAQWKYVAWPCGGAFPVELMRSALPWSVSLSEAAYDLSASRIQVYIKEEISGAEFMLQPGNRNENGYCAVSTAACGSGPCLIFHPDLESAGISEYVQNQRWLVRITGLQSVDGEPAEISYTCEMSSLYPQDVANIELSRLEAELVPGETLQLQADVIPAYADDPSVLWGSSDPAVATVDGNGLVTAVAPGSCTITAMSGNGRRDTCEITIQ